MKHDKQYMNCNMEVRSYNYWMEERDNASLGIMA